MELNQRFTSTQDDIAEAQMGMLRTLREIRTALISNPTQSSSKDVSHVKEENEKLKKINSKQKYRIEHLIMTVQELQDKLKAKE